ncbi:MAG TPA: hypothetical protein VGI97_10695, partial [Gemmatimonadaceae bacterium]
MLKSIARLIGITLAGASGISAQELPPIQPLGPIRAFSDERLAAASQVRALPGGRLLVNDNTGRRLLLFDSTLKRVAIVADTSGRSAAYGASMDGLIAYRGDSSLLVDPRVLAMAVVDGDGRIVRTMAVPTPADAPYLIGGPFGTPGVDPRGRLVYRARAGGFGRILTLPRPGSAPQPQVPDSALVLRFDFASRRVDTVAKLETITISQKLGKDEN